MMLKRKISVLFISIILVLMIIIFMIFFQGINISFAHQMKGAKETFTRILGASKTGKGFLFISIIVAFLLGSLHALTPGHGKAVVATYLIGSGGKIKDAFILGVTVTIAHISSVVIIGIILLMAAKEGLPPRLTPVLGTISGFIIIFIGSWLVISLSRNKIGLDQKEESSHIHKHNNPLFKFDSHRHIHPHHPHHDIHHPTHNDKAHAGIWSTLSIGISGGLVPCPAALVVLLMAVSINRIMFGFILIISFSIGLAAVLILLGILFTTASSIFKRYMDENRFLKVLPTASAVIMVGIGIIITIKSFLQIGIFK